LFHQTFYILVLSKVFVSINSSDIDSRTGLSEDLPKENHSR